MQELIASTFSDESPAVSMSLRNFGPSMMRCLRLAGPMSAISAMVIAIVAVQVPRAGLSCRPRLPFQSQFNIRPAAVAQNEDTDENEVSTNDLEKYVSVYKAMQLNRGLTAEQAAAAQGLTIQQFRQLENRVERDDAALQQARDELQGAAAQASHSPGEKP